METQTQPQTQTQLTVVDLANLQQLLDTAASRGAFRAGEMQQVGEIYNKLAAFLSAVAEQQQAAQQTEEGQSADEGQEPATEPQGEENA